MKPAREFLGLDQDMGGRRKVFLLSDGLETDEATFLRIERTRVYFDDVLAITYHRQRGVIFMVATGLMTLLCAGIAILVFAEDTSRNAAGAVAVFAIFGAPFLIGFVLRLIFQVDVVSVYGKRTSTRFKFHFRKQRARMIYGDLVDKIRARQQKAAAAAAPPQAPVPEALMPPSTPLGTSPPPPPAPPTP